MPEAQPTEPLLSSDFGAVFERIDTDPGGRLLVRGSTLMVQPFDVTTRTLAGQPVPLVEGIATVNQYVPVSTSRTGALAFRTGPAVRRRTLAWFDRNGKSLGDVGLGGRVYVQMTFRFVRIGGAASRLARRA
jgi:hypothetical protein